MGRSMQAAAAARAMGMKTSEIVALERARDGWVATTHDGQRTLLDLVEGEVVVLGPYTPPAPDQSAATGEEVPEGTEKDVLAWVGEDPGRAAAALECERTKDTPRKGLVTKLEQLA